MNKTMKMNEYKKNIGTKTLIGLTTDEIDDLVSSFRKKHNVIAVQSHVVSGALGITFVYVVFFEL